MRLNDEEAELLAKFAELRGEKVSSVHEGLLSRIRSAFKP
jgi:O-succinylbenzoate synthase